MKRSTLTHLLLLFVFALTLPAAAAPTITRTDASVVANLDNAVTLTFAVEKGILLGLQKASAQGIELKSDATVVRPCLIEEWKEKPFSWDGLALTDAKVEGSNIVLSGDLVSAEDGEGQHRLFVMEGDAKAIHLDYYRFPHVQLPSDILRIEPQKTLAAKCAGRKSAGTWKWIIEPATQNIGGFTWRGWKHHYEFALADGRKLNCVRELATWETNGTASGNTLVALRYRGLGGLAPKLEPLDPTTADGPVKNAFTSTEILPGAVAKAPLVSPVMPGPQNISGREEGMKHRHGAWIAQPQRGAGSNWIDFQFRPTVALTSYYEKVDAIRTVSEVWPGDRQVSYTDCLYFPLTDKISTLPKTHLALVSKDPLADNEWRTRYLETDLYVRAIVCKDLDYVQDEPVPSLGVNWDSGWEGRIPGAIAAADAWKAAGVKRVFFHHPGWFNGRGLRQKETSYPIPQAMISDPKKPGEPAKLSNDTGGDCSIHDYIPQSDEVRDLWIKLSKKLNEDGIENWSWVTGMVYGTGPVAQKFGVARFCRNSPDVDFSSGYPGENGKAGHRGISVRDPQQRDWFVGRLNQATDELGMQGIWADSFQNMFMSQMNYQQADWAPQVREHWQIIAALSQRGVGFMAESTAFPGLSCSVEVGDQVNGYEGEEFTLMYSTRWYRGTKVLGAGTPRADRLFFRTMANKGPIAPGDGDPAQIPSMKRFSDEYMAALPAMNRPYQLQKDAGVLWLSFADDKSGVLFAFADADLPAGVKAQGIIEKSDAPRFGTFHTYTVSGDDLLKMFGLQRGDQVDPRLGAKYVPPAKFIKDWSK